MWPKQYSIRGILLFTAFVAVVLMWWLERHNHASRGESHVRVLVSGDRASVVDTVTGETATGQEKSNE